MITLITRPWRRLLVSLLVPILLVGCGGGGGGGGESATTPAPSSSNPPPAAPTGFVDARAVNRDTGLQIAAPISILQSDGVTKTGTGRVFSDNLPVGAVVIVTFGDFSSSNFADPQTNPVPTVIAAGANVVIGAYVPLPPPP